MRSSSVSTRCLSWSSLAGSFGWRTILTSIMGLVLIILSAQAMSSTPLSIDFATTLYVDE